MGGHPDIQEMRTSADGIELIKEFEDFFPNAYRDPVGVWTIGWGHTDGVEEGDVITKEEGEVYLAADLRETERYIKHYVQVPLTQHQFDALVSLVFNMGIGNFVKSSVYKFLNRGNYAEACKQFSRYVNGTHRDTGETEKFEGLVRRRAAEMALWNLPDHVPSDKSPIWPPLNEMGEGGVKADVDKPVERPTTDVLKDLVTKSGETQALLTAMSGLVTAVSTMLQPLKENPVAAIVLGLVGAGLVAALVIKFYNAKALS